VGQVRHAHSLVATSATAASSVPAPVGAGRVILIAGAPKVVVDVEEGLRRVHVHVPPLEDARARVVFGVDSCVSRTLIIDRAVVSGRITVVLVDEAIGSRRRGLPGVSGLDRGADGREDAGDLAAKEEQGRDRDDGDEREDQGVLRETLTCLVSRLKEVEHGTSPLMSLRDDRRGLAISLRRTAGRLGHPRPLESRRRRTRPP
jgi:hypothetical protein